MTHACSKLFCPQSNNRRNLIYLLFCEAVQSLQYSRTKQSLWLAKDTVRCARIHQAAVRRHALFWAKRVFYLCSVEFLYGFLRKYHDLLNYRTSRPLWPRLSRPLLECQTWISPTIQLITPVSVQLWLESTVAYPGSFRSKKNCTHLDWSSSFFCWQGWCCTSLSAYS